MLLILAPIRELEPANQKIEISAVRQYTQSQLDNQQWLCLDELWQRESSWQTKKRPWLAQNSRSGAYGIPQSLPATKMQTKGKDYRVNPYTQVDWGLSYISERYQTPCEALKHHDRKGWY
jgi:hypothetical protein